jgi:plastocyanin
MRVRGFMIILFVNLLMVGCSGDENKDTHHPKTLFVSIAQMKFTPAELHVNSGDTVVWENKDIVDHNVMEETSKEWNSGVISKGQTWKMTVTKNTNYFCSVHPGMKGKLVVE